MARLAHAGLAILVALDALVCTVWLAALYPFALSDRPTGRQTISGYVGGAALVGQRWGIIAERLIDALFGAGHCLRSYQRGQG